MAGYLPMAGYLTGAAKLFNRCPLERFKHLQQAQFEFTRAMQNYFVAKLQTR